MKLIFEDMHKGEPSREHLKIFKKRNLKRGVWGKRGGTSKPRRKGAMLIVIGRGQRQMTGSFQ